jgi:hypothetical protein
MLIKNLNYNGENKFKNIKFYNLTVANQIKITI